VQQVLTCCCCTCSVLEAAGTGQPRLKQLVIESCLSLNTKAVSAGHVSPYVSGNVSLVFVTLQSSPVCVTFQSSHLVQNTQLTLINAYLLQHSKYNSVTVGAYVDM